MYEECNGAEKYYFYDSNGVISGIRYFDANGTMTMIYVVTNALGDVIALYDKNGNAVVEYQYDAWGNIISIKNGDGTTLSGDAVVWNEINPFRYRGYYYDSETGLYYLNSRYYDAETGRFINADHYVSTGLQVTNFNMFAYCYNNPVNMTDIYGAWPKWLEDAAEWVCDNVIEPVIEFADEAITTLSDSYVQRVNMERELAEEQQKAVKGAFCYVADCYYQSLQMQSASQRQAAEPVADFIIDRFSTPEKASNTFSAIGYALEVAAAYCGVVAVDLSIPTLGMSSVTAGKIAAILVILSLSFKGAALGIEFFTEE